MIAEWLLLPFRLLASFVIAIPWLIGYVLGFPAVAIGLLFCRRKSEHMPWPFWLWDSYAGINGTLGGANLNWLAKCGGDLETRTYGNRWIFLAWRNPCGNLGGKLLAARMPRPYIIQISGGWWLEYWASGWLWSINLFDSRIRLGWKLQDRGQLLFRFRTWQIE